MYVCIYTYYIVCIKKRISITRYRVKLVYFKRKVSKIKPKYNLSFDFCVIIKKLTKIILNTNLLYFETC